MGDGVQRATAQLGPGRLGRAATVGLLTVGLLTVGLLEAAFRAVGRSGVVVKKWVVIDGPCGFGV